jgi:hypothetical protein
LLPACVLRGQPAAVTPNTHRHTQTHTTHLRCCCP